MIKWIAGLLIMIGGIQWVIPANATPPQIVSVDDIILGENDTHLFILRKIGDNHGHHHISAADILLIAKNLSNGEDDETWPVQSQVDYSPYFSHYGRDERIKKSPLKNGVDPFAILRQRGARSLLPQTDDRNMIPRISDSGISITAACTNNANQPSYHLDVDKAAAQIKSSLRSSRKILPAQVMETGEDSLLAGDIILEKYCKTDGLYRYWPKPPLSGYAVKVRCVDDNDPIPLSVYVIVSNGKIAELPE